MSEIRKRPFLVQLDDKRQLTYKCMVSHMTITYNMAVYTQEILNRSLSAEFCILVNILLRKILL